MFVMENLTLETVVKAFHIIRRDINRKRSAFEIDEEYMELHRYYNLCRNYIIKHDENLARYI